MAAAGSAFDGTFILFFGINQKFSDSGVKLAIASVLYIKPLKDSGDIGYPFLISHEFVCSEQAIPCECVGIRMFIDRISVSVITLNLIPLHVPVFPGFYADIVVLVKTIVDAYTPDAVRRMSLSQASGSSCIAFVLDPVKTDVQGMDGNEKLGGNSMCRISIPGESHICRRNAFNHLAQSFMFRSKIFRENHVKFDRAGEGRSLFGFHFNGYFPSGLLDLFFTGTRIYLKCYRVITIGDFSQTAFKQLFSLNHFPLNLILRLQQKRLFTVQGNGDRFSNADFSALSVFLLLFFRRVFVTGQFGGTVLRFRYQFHDIGKFLIFGMKKGKR